jgi:hypothetical protein
MCDSRQKRGRSKEWSIGRWWEEEGVSEAFQMISQAAIVIHRYSIPIDYGE